MSGADWGSGSDLDLARAFTVEGLAGAGISAPNARKARIADQPVPWKLGRKGGPDQGMGLGPEAERLLNRYMPAVHGADDASTGATPDGLRLLAPLRWEIATGHGSEAIGRILGHPGYRAAANVGGEIAGLKSLAIDCSVLPELPDYLNFAKSGRDAVFSWPMSIQASDEAYDALLDSRVAERQFVEFSHGIPRNTPSIFADIIEVDGTGFTGSYLALRFLPARSKASQLPDRMSVASLARHEPVVLLPLDGRDAAGMLTSFVYELSHNLPVDVAAWQAVRHGDSDRHMPPVVLAPRRFLDHSRLSDTIPGLQARLGRLAPDRILPVGPDDLLRFNYQAFKDLDLSRPTAEFVRDLLGQKAEFNWDRELNTGEGLLAVSRAVEELEARLSSREQARPMSLPDAPATAAPPPAAPSGDAPSEASGREQPAEPAASPSASAPSASVPRYADGGADTFDTFDGDEFAKGQSPETSARRHDPSPSAEPPTSDVGPPPPPARYTDITVRDGERILRTDHTLIAERPYTLDVAIRTRRRGLAAGRDDQPVVAIEGQTETANIWVVVTDETDRGRNPEGHAFDFDRHYAKLRLPVVGDSENSVSFMITPKTDVFKGSGRGQIGIRLYHKLNLIDHIELDVHVGGAQSKPRDGRPAIDVLFKRPADDAGIETPDERIAARALTISVTRKKGSDLYRFTFVQAKNKSGEPRIFATKTMSESMLNDFVARFRDILLKTVFGASLKDPTIPIQQRDDLLKDLSLLGTDIVTKMFDYESGFGDTFEIGEMVHEALADAPIVQISLSRDAEDFVFPWQILTLQPYSDPDIRVVPENLWGYRFVIEVKRPRDGADERPAAERIRTPARIRYGRWNFKNEPEHLIFLQGAMAAARGPIKLEPPVIDGRRAFIDALDNGGGDLLYVYAHGHAAAPNTPAGVAFNNRIRQQIDAIKQNLEANPLAFSAEQTAAWTDTYNLILKGSSNAALSSLSFTNSEVLLTHVLTARNAKNELIRLRDAPIVFLNTCESAQLWNAVEGSFVGFFLKRGARAVLGTESTIPIVVADVFGRAVLAQLFAGKSIGEAVKHARAELLQTNRNPLGLCYSIYGAADARLFAPPAQEISGRES